MPSNVLTLPPPVGGRNTRDPISEMDPRYGLQLLNWIPRGSYLELRKGFRLYSKVSGAASTATVQSLIPLVQSDGTRKLLGVVEDGSTRTVYDFSSSTASSITGAATINSGIWNGCNYQDKIFMATQDNTATAMKINYWSGTGNIAAAGFAADTHIRDATSYKGRLWMQYDALRLAAGYDDVNYGIGVITSTVRTYDVANNIQRGGKIIWSGGLSGVGVEQQNPYCVITSMGEMILFQGDYLISPTWQVIGHYFIPPPLGERAIFRYGSSLAILTSQGLLLSDEILGKSQLAGRYNYLTDIDPEGYASLVNLDSANHHLTSGIYDPNKNLLIIWSTTSTASDSVILVYEPAARAWCQFSGFNPACMAYDGTNVYFGTNYGKVMKFSTSTYQDEDPANEGAFLSRAHEVKFAYNNYGVRMQNKIWKEAIPYIEMSNGINIFATMNIDYETRSVIDNVYADSSDTDYKLYKPRIALSGQGRAGGFYFGGSTTNSRGRMNAVDIVFDVGGAKG